MKEITKRFHLPLTVLLSALAVIIGIVAGNLLYRMDTDLIKRMDTEDFKKTLNASMTMIQTVYNNGRDSTSFSGSVFGVISSIFGFDLHTPLTILNVQSPMFLSYYQHSYRPGQLSKESQEVTAAATPSITTPAARSAPATAAAIQEEAGATAGQDTSEEPIEIPPAEVQEDLQPVSSIFYEEEDEKGDADSDLVTTETVSIRNFTSHKIDIDQLLKEPLKLKFDKKGPKVLIYHTHTMESYVLKASDLGKEVVASYNANPQYNVVRVGEELAKYLKKGGIETLHNGTVHDKVRSSAYSVAINTLNSYQKSYPSLKVFIDIHRDGLDPSKPKLRLVKKINGRNAAQIMFVVGTGDMLPHPDWEENLKFVLKVEQKLNKKYPGLARPVWVVKKRYNQQISDQAVLIEIGGDGNLLAECIESTRYLSEALTDVLKGNE